MAPPRKTATEDKVLSRRILVVIAHGKDAMSKISKVIWHHEFPILEEVHGKNNIKIVDGTTMDEGYSARISPNLLPYNKTQDRIKPPSEVAGLGNVFYGSAEAEYERLAAAYGMHPEVKTSVVEYVYSRFSEGRFERALGLSGYEDMPDAQLRGIVVDYGYLPQINRDSTPEERRAAGDAYAKLNTMPREELLKLVEELAGEYA